MSDPNVMEVKITITKKMNISKKLKMNDLNYLKMEILWSFFGYFQNSLIRNFVTKSDGTNTIQ